MSRMSVWSLFVLIMLENAWHVDASPSAKLAVGQPRSPRLFWIEAEASSPNFLNVQCALYILRRQILF